MNLGAEATINIVDFLGLRCIRKHRLSKKYRVSELDERINRQRLLQEARCLIKCRNHEVHVPNLFLVDSTSKSLYLELIEGQTLKVVLNSDISPELKLSSLKDLAQEIAKMHDAEIVHGDLTTSNVIVRDNDNQVFVIDFGLGLLKPTLEDKAVDLYVLARAFTSTHPNSDLMVLQKLNTSPPIDPFICANLGRGSFVPLFQHQPLWRKNKAEIRSGPTQRPQEGYVGVNLD